MNLTGKTVTLAHGAGGKQTAELIGQVFRAHFSNPYFTADDAAVLPAPDGRIAMTTDGFSSASLESVNLSASLRSCVSLMIQNDPFNSAPSVVNE